MNTKLNYMQQNWDSWGPWGSGTRFADWRFSFDGVSTSMETFQTTASPRKKKQKKHTHAQRHTHTQEKQQTHTRC